MGLGGGATADRRAGASAIGRIRLASRLVRRPTACHAMVVVLFLPLGPIWWESEGEQLTSHRACGTASQMGQLYVTLLKSYIRFIWWRDV